MFIELHNFQQEKYTDKTLDRISCHIISEACLIAVDWSGLSSELTDVDVFYLAKNCFRILFFEAIFSEVVEKKILLLLDLS